LPAITNVQHELRSTWISIEDEKTGRVAIQSLHDRLPVPTVSHGGKDKLARAQPAILFLEKGKLFFPDAPWRTVAGAKMLS